MSTTTVKRCILYKHPTANNTFLRVVYMLPNGLSACQLYHMYTGNDGKDMYWWGYDGRMNMKDDVQEHDYFSLELERAGGELECEIVYGDDPVSVWLHVTSDGGVSWFTTKDGAEKFADYFDANDPEVYTATVQEVVTVEGSEVWWKAIEGDAFNECP